MSTLSFAGYELTHVRPVKPPVDGNAQNKAGRLNLRGMCGDTSVKLYEAAGPEHAAFIEEITSSGRLSTCFPKVLGRSRKFLLVEWVQGTPGLGPLRLQVAQLRRIAELQANLISLRGSDCPPAGFDYWSDFVVPRFQRACSLLEASDVAAQLIEQVGEHTRGLPTVVMHPDLTPRNTVFAEHGLTSIDNELLTTGRLPLLDLANTAYAMNKAQAAVYVKAYGRVAEKEFSKPGALSALRCAWVARIVGARVVAGDITGSLEVLSRFRNGNEVLPRPLEQWGG